MLTKNNFFLVLFGSFFIVSPCWAQAKKEASKDTKKKAATPAKKADSKKKVAPAKKATPVSAPKQKGLTGKEKFQLITIEEKAGRLKEQIFRSKARLMLLEETVLRGSLTTAKLKIVHDNRMGATFHMIEASYILDGKSIFFRIDHDGSLNKEKQFSIFDGMLQPGPHRISVRLKFRGHGYGIFSYIRGYKFYINRRANFKVKAGQQLTIKAVAFEKNPLTTPLTKRPTMKFETRRKRIFKSRKKYSNLSKK